MAMFDFITNEAFRASLESDYSEMIASIDSDSWKAAHVLAGSIVEAILIDHLVSESLVTMDDALKMDFGTALTTCRTKNVISSKTSDLSSVIKGYRNLIHPGRLIRLDETVSRNSAEVAKALVGMVVEEIEQRRRKHYGYTAEQIVSKLQRDPLAEAIVPHLLRQSNYIEIERLLLKILPNAYLNASDDPFVPPTYFHLLGICFRAAFEFASNDIKTKVTERFVCVIKEESESTVAAYSTAFFRCTDLQFVSSDDADLVRTYLLGRLSAKVTSQMLHTLEGVGRFLVTDEVMKFVDPLVPVISSPRDNALAKTAEERLYSEWTRSPSEIDSTISNRINDWIVFYQERNSPQNAEKLSLMKDLHDIPF